MAKESLFDGASPLLKMLGRSFEEGDTTKYTRTDVLRALITPLAGTVAALPVMAWAKVPTWIIATDAVGAAALGATYIAVYLYCFVKRPDSLRSETFELAKYAIEHQVFGDNTTGLIEGEPIKALTGATHLTDASGGPG